MTCWVKKWTRSKLSYSASYRLFKNAVLVIVAVGGLVPKILKTKDIVKYGIAGVLIVIGDGPRAIRGIYDRSFVVCFD